MDAFGNQSVLQGLLSESLCKQSIVIKTEPITDKYVVEARPFARGKFATVRRCQERREGGAEFAAKYMRKRRRAADVRHEIVHEALVLQLSAGHPHVVQLREVYETPQEIILVLELVPGGELQRVLDDEEVVPERDAARLLRQILAGLSFLHDHKIAHLDLKPQNLLLTKPFPHCEVKLCDFGISRLITKGIEIREIVGTPDYVAPEVLHYEPISLPTDMWSIGILTYVLLSGHSPFGGDTKQETFCNITRGTLEFPADLFGTISHSAKDFIRKLLSRNPKDRMSAKECLSHPWLCDTEASINQTNGIELTLSPSSENSDSDLNSSTTSSFTDDDPNLSSSSANFTTPCTPSKMECAMPCNTNLSNHINNCTCVTPKTSQDKTVIDKESKNGLSRSFTDQEQKNGFSKSDVNQEQNGLSTCVTNHQPQNGLSRSVIDLELKNRLTTSVINSEFKNGFTKSMVNQEQNRLTKSGIEQEQNSTSKSLIDQEQNRLTTSIVNQELKNGFTRSIVNQELKNGSSRCVVNQDLKSELTSVVNQEQKNGLTRSVIDQEQKPRSVDVMVTQFEGISISKRIVFTEEIIEERVGMVY